MQIANSLFEFVIKIDLINPKDGIIKLSFSYMYKKIDIFLQLYTIPFIETHVIKTISSLNKSIFWENHKVSEVYSWIKSYDNVKTEPIFMWFVYIFISVAKSV